MRRRDLMMLLGGTAFMAPVLARAQQKLMPVVGVLTLFPLLPGNVAALRDGLNESGFTDGQNVVIEYRSADNDDQRLPALATELVAGKADVIVAAAGDAPALAAKHATPTIPIVFTTVGDPVEAGLVANLSRPGGNLTGFTVQVDSLEAKRLELVSELVPQARLIALLVNANRQYAAEQLREGEEAAHAKRVQFLGLPVHTGEEIETAFGTLAEHHAEALVVGSDPFFTAMRERLIELTARQRLPTIYFSRRFVDVGGLVSYGADFTALYRQAGTYVGRILTGTKPADLPVQQPSKFELVINLKAAKGLGLTVPQSILARADEIIE